MQAEHPVSERRRLSWRFFIQSALIAPLAPLLADCLQSLAVVSRGIRFYQATFQLYLDRPTDYCVLLGGRAVVTLLFLWLFAGLGFRGRIVWIGLLIIWLVMDFALEPAATK